MKRRLAWLLLASSCLFAPGCEENVWLPDSSGFVFVRRDHCLVHYDLATKTERVIVKHDWLCATDDSFVMDRPAVSPDGKQVALVRHTSSRDAETAQILTYDLSGKPIHASPEITLPGHADLSRTPVVRAGMAFWSPDGRRILFDVLAPLDKARERVRLSDPMGITTLGLYDLRTKRHMLFTGLELDEEEVAMAFSPFTPDGRGFMAIRKAKKRQKPEDVRLPSADWDSTTFVDWEGREYRFRTSPTVQEARAQEEARIRANKRSGRSSHDATIAPHWEKGVLVYPAYRGQYLLDPTRLLVTYEPNEVCSRLNDYAAREDVDLLLLNDNALVQFRKTPPDAGPGKPVGDNLAMDDFGTPGQRVEIEIVTGVRQGDPTKGKTIKVATVDNIDACVASPNGQNVLVRGLERCEGGAKSRRLVIDAQGKIVANLPETTLIKKRSPPAPPGPPEPPAPVAPPPA
jgi:hypothetical protein